MSGPGDGFNVQIPGGFAFNAVNPPFASAPGSPAFQTGPNVAPYVQPTPPTGAQPAGSIVHSDPAVAPAISPGQAWANAHAPDNSARQAALARKMGRF